MTEALNNQINAEMYSSYLYLSMSAYLADKGVKGGSQWFYVQAKEEMLHTEKLYNYVISQGSRITLKSIDAPPSEFDSLLNTFEKALAHEKKVTGLINDLVTLAVKEKDHATEIFLQWFVTEQIEEEENATDIIGQLRLAGEVGPGMFMMDRELAARAFVPAQTV